MPWDWVWCNVFCVWTTGLMMERQVIIPHYYTVRSRLKLSLIENFLIPPARPSEARSWMRCSDTQPTEAELSHSQRQTRYWETIRTIPKFPSYPWSMGNWNWNLKLLSSPSLHTYIHPYPRTGTDDTKIFPRLSNASGFCPLYCSRLAVSLIFIEFHRLPAASLGILRERRDKL